MNSFRIMILSSYHKIHFNDVNFARITFIFITIYIYSNQRQNLKLKPYFSINPTFKTHFKKPTSYSVSRSGCLSWFFEKWISSKTHFKSCKKWVFLVGFKVGFIEKYSLNVLQKRLILAKNVERFDEATGHK